MSFIWVYGTSVEAQPTKSTEKKKGFFSLFLMEKLDACSILHYLGWRSKALLEGLSFWIQEAKSSFQETMSEKPIDLFV